MKFREEIRYYSNEAIYRKAGFRTSEMSHLARLWCSSVTKFREHEQIKKRGNIGTSRRALGQGHNISDEGWQVVQRRRNKKKPMVVSQKVSQKRIRPEAFMIDVLCGR